MLKGYQRILNLNHVKDIQLYLDSPNPMMPNSIVIAFDHRITFTAGPTSELATHGILTIPDHPELQEGDRPGFVIDGQQRIEACQAAATPFNLMVSAFITDDLALQRSQFILLNSTKPLPKDLITVLLPTLDADPRGARRQNQLAATIADRLDTDRDSPFKNLICTPLNPKGIILLSALIEAIENHRSDGALYKMDMEQALALLKTFWQAIKNVFANSWGKKPRDSRLHHKAGLIALSFILDAIMETEFNRPDLNTFEKHLAPLAPRCNWASGTWMFADDDHRQWNQIGAVGEDVTTLSDHLRRIWKEQINSRA